MVRRCQLKGYHLSTTSPSSARYLTVYENNIHIKIPLYMWKFFTHSKFDTKNLTFDFMNKCIISPNKLDFSQYPFNRVSGMRAWLQTDKRSNAFSLTQFTQLILTQWNIKSDRWLRSRIPRIRIIRNKVFNSYQRSYDPRSVLTYALLIEVATR